MGIHIYNARLPKYFSCGMCHDKGLHSLLEDCIEDFDCSGNSDDYANACKYGCPLEEIEPHGDLVDKNEIDVLTYEDADGLHTEISAPTVIEAEGE